jgi:hypothetical protein
MLLRGNVGVLVFQPADQFFVRSVGDHAVELGAKVVDHADVFDDDVINPPLSADTVARKGKLFLAFIFLFTL